MGETVQWPILNSIQILSPNIQKFHVDGRRDKAKLKKDLCDFILQPPHLQGSIPPPQKKPPFLDSSPLKMGPIGCPETSVINYHYLLRNNPEDRGFLPKEALTDIRRQELQETEQEHVKRNPAIRLNYSASRIPGKRQKICCSHQPPTTWTITFIVSDFVTTSRRLTPTQQRRQTMEMRMQHSTRISSDSSSQISGIIPRCISLCTRRGASFVVCPKHREVKWNNGVEHLSNMQQSAT